MTIAERFHRLGLVITLIAAASYACADNAWPIALLAAALAFTGWYFTQGGFKRILPAWLTTTLIWLAVARAVFFAFSGQLDISAFCQFLLGIIVIKMWDRKLAKDWSQILTLSAFLVIGSVLSSNAISTGILLVIGVPIFVYAVILLQICHAQQRAAAIATASHAVPPPPGRWTPGLAIQLRRAAMWSLAGGLVLSLAVFFIMPRDIGRGSFGRWLQTRASSVSGFSDTVQLGRTGPIYTSREIVLDMAVKDKDGKNVGSVGRIFYLRGATMDQYRGQGLWMQQDEAGRTQDSLFPGTVKAVRNLRLEPPGPGTLVQEFLIRNATPRAPMFAIWQPVSIQFEKNTDVLLDHDDLTLLREQGAPGPMRYTVVSDAGVPQTAVSTTRTPGVTFPSTRIREIAESILKQAQVEADPALRPYENDSTAARAIETYLRENFLYSLDQQPIPRGKDPIEWFLDEGRQGHCEYFASAMTAMLRSVGVNARMVTGYVAADFNSTSGHYIVRESNAHAWVEVLVHTGEWRQYDPTPPANFHQFHDRPRTLQADFFGFLDAIEYAWVDSVVGFDESSRLKLFGGKGPSLPWFDRISSSLANRAERGGKRLANDALINGLIAMGLVGGFGFLTLGLSHLFRRSRRKPAWLPSGLSASEQEHLASMAAFYDELLKIWTKAGRPKPATLAPLSHAREFPSADTAARSARLSELFYKVRFGRQDLSQAELDEVAAALDQLNTSARTGGLSGPGN